MSGSDRADQRDGERPHAARKDARRRNADASAATRALRSVYDDTLREEIPADLSELLGRLG